VLGKRRAAAAAGLSGMPAMKGTWRRFLGESAFTKEALRHCNHFRFEHSLAPAQLLYDLALSVPDFA
jgi:hypothetical protein